MRTNLNRYAFLMLQISEIERLLSVIENHIIPKIDAGVATGSKAFGAAILRKSNFELVLAGANNEVENPLWHGEVHTLKQFYEMPRESRPKTSDCIFLTTHEPCSLCLSAITWAGFDNFYYFFDYSDTEDTFNIPHDLKILTEVFNVKHGEYARQNHYWSCYGLQGLIAEIAEGNKTSLKLNAQANSISDSFDRLSKIYQIGKGQADIPLN